MTVNMWDQRYASSDFAYGTEPNDFLRQQAGALPSGNTLCLGEGEGRNAVFLAGIGHAVTALDASAVGLDKARQLADARGVNIRTRQQDLQHYELTPQRWDAIVSIFCHLPAAVRKKVHEQVVFALKPCGVFLLEAYTPDQLSCGTGGPPVREMMMDLASLRVELQGLEIQHGIETVREIYEGQYHHGKGAVVQVIASRPS